MDKDSYFANGFYCGKLEEIFPDMTFLNECFNLIKQSFETKENWKYNHSILHDQTFPSIISIDEIPARKEFVKKTKFTVFQQLYVAPVQNEIRQYIQPSIVNFIKPLYPLTDEFNYHHNDSLSALTSGDYIKNHKDGNNPNRLCGILIYASEHDEYLKNEGGGELVINNDIVIPPVKGTFVLLDYLLNNLSHEVRPVTNDFTRLTYINFISKQNNE